VSPRANSSTQRLETSFHPCSVRTNRSWSSPPSTAASSPLPFPQDSPFGNSQLEMGPMSLKKSSLSTGDPKWFVLIAIEVDVYSWVKLTVPSNFYMAFPLSTHFHTMLILNAARLRTFGQHSERVFLALITKIQAPMFHLMHSGRCEAVRQIGEVH
jgi:hypothetical protein